MQTTRVGAVEIEVRNAKFCAVVNFAAGAHGVGERGHYCFWTAVLRRKKPGMKRKFIVGRARLWLPPGDRFDRMQYEMLTAARADDRAAYRRMWEFALEEGRNIAYIRPAGPRELWLWIRTHEGDAKHIRSVFLEGREWG